MNIASIIKNPLVLALGKELISPLVGLVKSLLVPKVKRLAFEKLTEGMQEVAEFILEQKEKVEKSENKIDDEAYKLTKEAYKAALDEGYKLYEKM